MAQEKQIPRWIEKLHLSNLYHKLIQEQMVIKDVRARIFRKKVVSKSIVYYNAIDLLFALNTSKTKSYGIF